MISGRLAGSQSIAPVELMQASVFPHFQPTMSMDCEKKKFESTGICRWPQQLVLPCLNHNHQDIIDLQDPLLAGDGSCRPTPVKLKTSPFSFSSLYMIFHNFDVRVGQKQNCSDPLKSLKSFRIREGQARCPLVFFWKRSNKFTLSLSLDPRRIFWLAHCTLALGHVWIQDPHKYIHGY